MEDIDARRKAELIKKALKLVDKLADLDVGEIEDNGNFDDLQYFIDDAQALKKDRLWKLN